MPFVYTVNLRIKYFKLEEDIKMKNRIREILLVIFFLSFTVTAQTGNYPPAATLYKIDTSTQGTNTNPTILQKNSAVPNNSADVRIHTTTNSSQSEMSIAVSPINNQILLASANASDYPVTTIYGTFQQMVAIHGQATINHRQKMVIRVIQLLQLIVMVIYTLVALPQMTDKE